MLGKSSTTTEDLLKCAEYFSITRRLRAELAP